MDLSDTNENPCLICLKNKVFFDWSEAIFEFYGPSYKDCYKQFINLQDEQDEELSQMLCLDCGNSLRNAYQLVEKALSTNLKHTNGSQCRICLRSEVFFDGTEAVFEFFGPSYNECYYQYSQLQEQEKDSTQMFCLNCGNGLRNIHQLVEEACKTYMKLKETPIIKYEIERVTTPDAIEKNLDNCIELELDESLSEFLILSNQNETEEQNNILEVKEESNSMYSSDSKRTVSNEGNTNAPENKPKEKRRPLMCSYCSKIFYSRNHFTKHEETHTKRERTEACPICGLKFYTAVCVKNHMTVHDENRVRKYKCEYCSKAFYSCGGLNCHRRKHLDEWFQCQLCPKKYCRQYELNRHVRSHDAAPITKDDLGTKSKYYAMYKECNTCGKKVNKYNWESHNAIHLNQPLVECSLCSKSFFNRLALCRHLQKNHDVEKAEYDNYIIKLNSKFKPRYSNLMKKQNIVID